MQMAANARKQGHVENDEPSESPLGPEHAPKGDQTRDTRLKTASSTQGIIMRNYPS